jgi:hypothetical protein
MKNFFFLLSLVLCSVMASAQVRPLVFTGSQTGTNQSPTVNAGVDQSITLPTSSVTLTATASDPDGTIASYSWTRVSGPNTPTITSASSASTTVTGLVQGTYVFRCTVLDNQGASAQDDIQVVVNAAANQAPTANAGVDQSITLPTSSVSLSGSGTDPDGTIASYAWTRVSGPNTPTITSASSASTTVTGLVQGTYVFRLTVTDNQGATGTDDVQVTVNAAEMIARFNFSRTANVVSGWNNMVAGASAVGNQTATDATTGWTLTTTAGEWELYYSFFALNNGEGGSSAASPTYTDFPATVLSGGFIQSQHSTNNGGANSYPFQFTNLPAGTYEIKVISSIRANINANLPNGVWRVKYGSAAETSQTITQQSNNTTNILIFTGTIAAGEQIRFGPFTPTESVDEATISNAVIIRKTN